MIDRQSAALGSAPEPLPTRDHPAFIIEPAPKFPRIDLRELWAYRGLFFFLVWRDIQVRYAQTVLGAGWAILQPVLTAAVFTVVFGLLVRMPSDGLPYPLFFLAGLVPWTYFSTALTGSSGSLVASTHLITKVYFPRLVIPFAPVLAGLMDFAIAFAVLLALTLAAGFVPSAATILLVPAAVLIMTMTAAGIGCWLAALNIQYRDVKHAVPFLVQIWMFASPIIYPVSLVPESIRPLYALNPMVSVVEGMRSALFGNAVVAWGMIGVSLGASLAFLVSGVLYFRRTERVFADVA
jgi:lipopolysaccharide transport system permease protein